MKNFVLIETLPLYSKNYNEKLKNVQQKVFAFSLNEFWNRTCKKGKGVYFYSRIIGENSRIGRFQDQCHVVTKFDSCGIGIGQQTSSGTVEDGGSKSGGLAGQGTCWNSSIVGINTLYFESENGCNFFVYFLEGIHVVNFTNGVLTEMFYKLEHQLSHPSKLKKNRCNNWWRVR